MKTLLIHPLDVFKKTLKNNVLQDNIPELNVLLSDDALTFSNRLALKTGIEDELVELFKFF